MLQLQIIRRWVISISLMRKFPLQNPLSSHRQKSLSHRRRRQLQQQTVNSPSQPGRRQAEQTILTGRKSLCHRYHSTTTTRRRDRFSRADSLPCRRRCTTTWKWSEQFYAYFVFYVCCLSASQHLPGWTVTFQMREGVCLLCSRPYGPYTLQVLPICPFSIHLSVYLSRHFSSKQNGIEKPKLAWTFPRVPPGPYKSLKVLKFHTFKYKALKSP